VVIHRGTFACGSTGSSTRSSGKVEWVSRPVWRSVRPFQERAWRPVLREMLDASLPIDVQWEKIGALFRESRTGLQARLARRPAIPGTGRRPVLRERLDAPLPIDAQWEKIGALSWKSRTGLQARLARHPAIPGTGRETCNGKRLVSSSGKVERVSRPVWRGTRPFQERAGRPVLRQMMDASLPIDVQWEKIGALFRESRTGLQARLARHPAISGTGRETRSTAQAGCVLTDRRAMGKDWYALPGK
jgi:hypothetical protein